jgi:hypothetical protein
MDLLVQLEQSGISRWVRESGSVFAYPTVLFLHTLGLAMAAGTSLAVDLRILGAASDAPLAPFRRFFPVLWAGFWINAASGILLACAAATTRLVNPVFYVKMAFIGVAVLSARVIFRSLAGSGPSKVAAWVSILAWTGAITAGRLLAYLGPQEPRH